MKEVIAKEVNGKIVVLGYLSTKVYSGDIPTDKTYKILRLTIGDVAEEGDIHVFEYYEGKWYLCPDKSLINLGNHELMDLYQFIPRNPGIELETFIKMIWDAIGIK